MKFKLSVILCLIVVFLCFQTNVNVVCADTLQENINEQIQNIDFAELEEFFNSINGLPDDVTFFEFLTKILNGKYDTEYNSIFSYIQSVLLKDIGAQLPPFILILLISILCGVLIKLKGNVLGNQVAETIIFVGLLSVIALLGGQIIGVWNNTKIVIENIAKLSEIMSPIILTLMVASGGNISASIYKPTVAFLTAGVINVVLKIIMPLIAVMIIFNILSNFTDAIKFEKFSAFIISVIKWIIGIIIAVYGLFLSIQGISSATFDGISVKATKFAISNSVPIIGGFLKDGFDLVVAGSVLIKNAVGFLGVFALFYIIFSPILKIAVFSLLLKLVSAIIEPLGDSKISNFCFSVSKSVTYLAISLITVAFMLFVTILLIMFSANAFL